MVLEDHAPHPFSQKEMNDLVRDPILPKDSAELLASKLKGKKIRSDSARISFFCNGHQEYIRLFFTVKDLVYCADIASFCSSSTNPKIRDCSLTAAWSLKCVLLHNGNQFAYVPVAHSTILKEKYEAVKSGLKKMVIISISGLFVLTWWWGTLCWDNSLVSSSTHVFCACGTVLSIIRRRTGLCGRNWCLSKKGTSSTTLWLTETEYSAHRCTSSLAQSSSSPRLRTGMVTASLTCAKLFQDWPGRSKNLAAHQRSRVRNSINEVELEAWKSFVLFVWNVFGNNTFPKGVSAMWNAISLVQDLNSCRRVNFLRR